MVVLEAPLGQAFYMGKPKTHHPNHSDDGCVQRHTLHVNQPPLQLFAEDCL